MNAASNGTNVATRVRDSAPNVRNTTVVLVDDHELVRNGLGGLVDMEDDLQVVGIAGTVAGALAAYDKLRPQVMICDLQLPDGTGFDIVRAVRARSKETGLVVLSMHAGDDQVLAAMEAGASAFVGKDAPSSEVVAAARHAAISPASFLSGKLVGAILRRRARESTRLSEREHQVLVLLADGLRAAEIGRHLHLSESTTKSHITRIYQKLQATNRAQALVKAMRIGLLSNLPGSSESELVRAAK